MSTPTKTWTWASHMFNNWFESYEEGQKFTNAQCLMPCAKGDVITIKEFCFHNWKAAVKAYEDGGRVGRQAIATEFLTGREMVVEVVGRWGDTVDMSWGMPKVTKHGDVTLLIISKTVSDSYNAMNCHP